MKRGIRILIPNKFGKYLADILEPIDCVKYNWNAGFHTEIWKVTDGKLGDALFSSDIATGNEFLELITNNSYYMIFATLKAFPKGAAIVKIDKYEDFLNSDCEVCLLAADCSYVDVYCKDISLIEKLYDNAKLQGYEKIKYIEEDDSRTVMYA